MRKSISRAVSSLSDRYSLVRDIRAGTLLEDFFISAVCSVLVIRLYLHLTGYPEIGGGKLHFAHVLWGGLLMLLAVIIMLSFLSRSAREMAAVIGGVGFGAFIDELGKFITADNDYFFKPTVALIYISFVLLFLLFRAIGNLGEPTRRECLANALEMAKEGVLRDGLSRREQERAQELLDQCDPNDRLVKDLRDIILQTATIPPRKLNMLSRTRQFLRSLYGRLVAKSWFTLAVVAFFVLGSVFTMAQTVVVVERSWALTLWLVGGAVVVLAELLSGRIRIPYLRLLPSVGLVVVAMVTTWALVVDLREGDVTFIDYGRLIFPTISGILVLVGIGIIHRSRLGAFQMFYRAVLISILLTQGFAFYEDQFLALLGLFLDVVILLVLRHMISQEEAALKEMVAEAEE